VGASDAGGGPDAPALLAAASSLADIADGIALAHFGGPVPATVKPDGSRVTEADRAIEAALRQEIAARFPAHAILGEEEGGAIDPAVPTWVVDPIDATHNFMRGIPIFATLVGVVADGRAVVGVASAPALGERWAAAAGCGATRNGVPVGVSAIADLADAQVLHGGLSWYREVPALWELLGDLADTARRTRGFGDFWNHLLVAGGMAEVAFERDLKPWDIAALECIVTEAGGRLTSFRGGSALTDGDVLTTNGLLHERMLGLLEAVPTDG
jgi:histidinol-phosphatase